VVSLTAGSRAWRLVVFGQRWWRRNAMGRLVASEPERFDTIAVTWDRAYGGAVERPPGLLPGTDLPHPGGRLVHPLNPSGVGWHGGEPPPADSPLPNVESADHLIRGSGDTPHPVGLAPCPELPQLRMLPYGGPQIGQLDTAEDRQRLLADHLLGDHLRLQHHAPSDLIVLELPPGTPVVLEGMGNSRIAFRVPGSPISVLARRRGRSRAFCGVLRSVHIDSDRRLVRVAYRHSFHYRPAHAPRWLDVTAAPSEAAA